jgi:hypothetical protein
LVISLFSLCWLPAQTVRGEAPRSQVLQWNARFISEMRKDTLFPAIIARNLAVLHSCIEEAYARDPACPEARISLVAFHACSSLLPAHAPAFEAALGEIYPGRIADGDRMFAENCVHPVLEATASDGASSHVTYMTRNEPGAWNRTAPFFRPPELPHWRLVRPIQLRGAGQFAPPGPPPLASERYAKDLLEVQSLGGAKSVARNPEQARIAEFWSDFSYTETPVGHWNSIARNVCAKAGLSAARQARLFKLLNVSMADAAIACWDAKYTFNFWRPITAITRAGEDENDATIADPSWIPFLKTPNHPEYPSGHSVFSAAASGILTRMLGADAVEFEVQSDTLNGVNRKFHRFSEAAKECGESRIFGGIHFRFSCEDGLKLGEQIADWVWKQTSDGAPPPTVR